MKYHFLLLSLIFAIPGVIIYWLRPDLRMVIRRLMLCSIPFAFTEFLFYPDYWKPEFLFDLANRIGFGIEDFLFVMGLSAFAGTVYPVVFQKSIRVHDVVSVGRIAHRLVILALITIALTIVQIILFVPMIYGSLITMLGVAAGITCFRRDLLVPLFLSGFLTTGVYISLCWMLLLFVPEIFRLNWNLDAFSATYVLGVPLEELMYGFAAGAVAGVFYPFVFSCRYVSYRAVA
ncbi:MAG: lycopene cyclase domain-containing protein [Desulfobacterales bacterium]